MLLRGLILILRPSGKFLLAHTPAQAAPMYPNVYLWLIPPYSTKKLFLLRIVSSLQENSWPGFFISSFFGKLASNFSKPSGSFSQTK